MEKEGLIKSNFKKGKIAIIIVIIAAVIIIFLIALTIYFYYPREEKILNLGESIEEVVLGSTDNVYIKLKEEINEKDIKSVKFIFKDKEGNEYFYETTSKPGEILYPSGKGKIYSYEIFAEEVGLEDFSDIDGVSVVFEYKIEEEEEVETEPLDIKKTPTTTTPGGGPSGPSPCTLDKDCSYYYDLGECGSNLHDGCSAILDCLDCNAGFYCYAGEGVNNICVNDSIECTDTDVGKDYFVKGNVTLNNFNISLFREDECDGNLTEYYCYYNGAEFEIRNESFECKNCSDGVCKVLVTCGDNVTDTREVCDGTDLGEKSCQDFGYNNGWIQGCCEDCNQFDLSRCYNETRTCVDYDGEDYYVASNVNYSYRIDYGERCPEAGGEAGGNEVGVYESKDSCNGNILYEKICNADNTTGTVEYDCSQEGKICFNGACMSAPVCGDTVLIEKGTDKLNLGDALTDIWTTKKIIDSDMPNLLADGTFISKDNINYDYEQYIALYDNLVFKHFDDDDYNEDMPALGIRMATITKVLNYTIDFTKDVRSDVDGNGRLEDMEDRDIMIMGSKYRLVNAYNESIYTKFVLMKGGVLDTINLNEGKNLTVDSKNYTVTLVYVDSYEAQFDIVDSEGTIQITTRLTVGGTYKLADGTQIGVTYIMYQGFVGGIMRAEFILDANKLTIEDTQILEIDDVNVNEITCYVHRFEPEPNKVDIQKIVLEWKTSNDEFVANDSTVLLPGLETIELSYGGFVTPCEETVKVRNTDVYGIELTVPIKDGDAQFGILNGDASNFNCVGRSKDCDKSFLRTGNTTTGDTIRFDRDTDDYFIASWNDTTNAESYLLKVSSISENDNKNYSTIQNIVTGSTWSNKQEGDTVTIGSVELTIGMVDKNENFVDLKINADGNFNKVYTAGGLEIQLPINSEMPAPNYILNLTEEDKDGNIGKGKSIEVVLDQINGEAQVTEVYANWSAGAYKEIDDTMVYEGYVESDLGTKVLFNKTLSGQKSADIVYHCRESSGKIYITFPCKGTAAGGGGVSEPPLPTLNPFARLWNWLGDLFGFN